MCDQEARFTSQSTIDGMLEDESSHMCVEGGKRIIQETDVAIAVNQTSNIHLFL